MKASNPDSATGIGASSGSMVALRERAHLEWFNGSDAMLSVRESVDEVKAAGRREAILTVRATAGALWTRTITIP